MTTERTRKLLGELVNNLTDQEVAEMIQKFSRLADVAVDLLIKKPRYDNNRLDTQKLHS